MNDLTAQAPPAASAQATLPICSTSRPPRSRDGLIASALGLAFLLAYLLLRHGTMAYDSVMFSWFAWHRWLNLTPQHPLYIPILSFAIRLGAACGLEVQTSGICLSSTSMAAAVASFYLVLRQWRVDRGVAALYASLLGLSAAALDNGTQTELYGPAFLIVVLSFWAFSRELRHPSRLGSLLLWAANAAVFAMHLGYAPWVLSLYLALMVHEWRSLRARSLWRLAQGMAVAAAPLLLMSLLAYPPPDWNNQLTFFNSYWRPLQGWAVLLRLLAAPVTDFASHAGFVIFPGIFGLACHARRSPALAMHALLASALFLLPYSFWVVDRGAFYMPLLPLWGLFAALGLQTLARAATRSLNQLTVVGVVTWGLIMFAYQAPTLPFASEWSRTAVVSGTVFINFYTLVVVLAWEGWRFRKAVPAPAATTRRFLILFAASSLALTLAAYLPLALSMRKVDGYPAMRRAAMELKTLDPPERKLLVLTTLNPERIEFDTGLHTAHPEKSEVIGWLRASRDPKSGMAIWTDNSEPTTFQLNQEMDWSPWQVKLTPRRFSSGVTLYKALLVPADPAATSSTRQSSGRGLPNPKPASPSH